MTENGKKQAGEHGALLKELGGVEELWVSPSGRTTETAFIVNSYVRADLHYADELMERDCGVWSGLLLEEIEQRFPDDWGAREKDPYWFQPPDGENLQDMLERVHEFLDSLFEEDLATVGLVTHGVMSRVILKFFLGLNEVECVRVRHPNDLLYRLTFNAQDIETHHFISGGDAQHGLLHSAARSQPHPIQERSE